MQFEKKATIGNFAKKDVDYKEGDILTILNAGSPVDGKFGTQYVFKVKLVSGEEKNLPFNQTSINKMIEAYGKESNGWIGKQVKVWLVTQNVQGEFKKVTYLTAPKQELIETDSGKQPELHKEKTINIDEEEINPEDIPF